MSESDFVEFEAWETCNGYFVEDNSDEPRKVRIRKSDVSAMHSRGTGCCALFVGPAVFSVFGTLEEVEEKLR